MVSGIISPISPLPDKGSQLNSPAHLASRSRISSIGDAMPPNIVIPKEDVAPVPLSVQQNGHAAPPAALVPALGGTGLGQREMLSGLDKGKAKATSPADGFLRGFLEDVARRGR
jgi:mRNA-decapping enzyme subunit 2